MQEKNNRWRDVGKRRDEKIGIGINPNNRRNQVKRGMSGRGLKVVFFLPVFFAGDLEKRLHRKYEKQSVKKKYKDGGSEFFDLNFFNRIVVRINIIFTFVYQWLFIVSVLLIFLKNIL